MFEKIVKIKKKIKIDEKVKLSVFFLIILKNNVVLPDCSFYYACYMFTTF